MKVYVAGAYPDKKRIAAFAEYLTEIHGVDITSTWLTSDQGVPEDLQQNMNRLVSGEDYDVRSIDVWPGVADQDLAEIDACDVFVKFELPAGLRGYESCGRHVELGYAIAKKKIVVLIGEGYESIFEWSKQVSRVENEYEAIQKLQQLGGFLSVLTQ